MDKLKNIASKYIGIIVLVVIVVAISFFSDGKDSDGRTVINRPSFNNFSETLGESVINCQFEVVSDYSLNSNDEEDKKIKYGTDTQKEPINMVFAGLNTKTPVVKANNGEDPLVVVSNTNSELTLASTNSFGDIFIYKIYKSQKVATWYKSYDLFGSPYAMLSMGYCY